MEKKKESKHMVVEYAYAFKSYGDINKKTSPVMERQERNSEHFLTDSPHKGKKKGKKEWEIREHICR
mgnify:CR=1 FL=1